MNPPEAMSRTEPTVAVATVCAHLFMALRQAGAAERTANAPEPGAVDLDALRQKLRDLERLLIHWQLALQSLGNEPI